MRRLLLVANPAASGFTGAELLRRWASMISVHSFDVAQGEQKISRSQRIVALREGAKLLARDSWVRTASMKRRLA